MVLRVFLLPSGDDGIEGMRRGRSGRGGREVKDKGFGIGDGLAMRLGMVVRIRGAKPHSGGWEVSSAGRAAQVRERACWDACNHLLGFSLRARVWTSPINVSTRRAGSLDGRARSSSSQRLASQRRPDLRARGYGGNSTKYKHKELPRGPGAWLLLWIAVDGPHRLDLRGRWLVTVGRQDRWWNNGGRRAETWICWQRWRRVLC